MQLAASTATCLVLCVFSHSTNRRIKLSLLQRAVSRDMTHSHVWHDSFVYGRHATFMCDMSHSCETADKVAPLAASWVAQVCVGCQNVLCILLHVKICVFSHPTCQTSSKLRLHTCFVRICRKKTCDCFVLTVLFSIDDVSSPSSDDECICNECICTFDYWVAMISRLVKSIGLFCRISSLL